MSLPLILILENPPPNNSLKLTLRAALSGMLESPARLAYSDGCAARFRRAA
jgi:hypothetical protein